MAPRWQAAVRPGASAAPARHSGKIREAAGDDRQRGGHRLLGPGLALAAAAALTAACPPVGWAWLAWAAPIPAFLALLKAAEDDGWSRSCGWIGFVLGAAYLTLLVPWFGAFTPVGYPAAAVYWGILGAIAFVVTGWALRRGRVLPAPLVLAAGWTFWEWLRAGGALAFPWGTLAFTQHRHLAVLQMLEITGSYGLSFLMALFAASVACGVRTRRAGWALGSGAAALALAGWGGWVLKSTPGAPRSVRVGIVQASYSYKAAGAAVVCVSPPEEYERYTREALAQGARLVLWPEAASPADLANRADSRARVAELLRSSGAHLLAGSFVLDTRTGVTTNSAVLVASSGQVLSQYAKVRIVPFGEYLPLRPLLRWTEQYGMPSEDLGAGAEWRPMAWPGGSIGTSICFESAFGGISRELVGKGADLLAILTSDGWAGRSAAGLQHLAFAPLRAVETRRAVARAGATGVSQLIDPYGRVLASQPMFRAGIVVGDLPLRTDTTLYVRLGDWPVGLSALLLLAGLFSPAFEAVRRRKD
jgi:apolipoprotein N-acyltransferase